MRGVSLYKGPGSMLSMALCSILDEVSCLFVVLPAQDPNKTHGVARVGISEDDIELKRIKV